MRRVKPAPGSLQSEKKVAGFVSLRLDTLRPCGTGRRGTWYRTAFGWTQRGDVNETERQ
jgi:hypothetical protein